MYNVKRHAVVQPLDQSIKLIPLTQGRNAVVDAVDYEWLMQWNWCAAWCPITRSFYATRRDYTVNRRLGITVPMHRVIMGMPTGVQVDHIVFENVEAYAGVRLFDLRQNE